MYVLNFLSVIASLSDDCLVCIGLSGGRGGLAIVEVP